MHHFFQKSLVFYSKCVKEQSEGIWDNFVHFWQKPPTFCVAGQKLGILNFSEKWKIAPINDELYRCRVHKNLKEV